MIIDRAMTEPDMPPEIQIREVRNQEEYEDTISILGSAFKSLSVDEEVWRVAYPQVRSMAASDIFTRVAYVNGTPTATGMVYTSHSVAEIIHVGTHPQFRRQGLGSLSTRALEAFNRVVLFASLQSTPMGVSVYRSIGYQEVGQYRWCLFLRVRDA